MSFCKDMIMKMLYEMNYESVICPCLVEKEILFMNIHFF